MPTETRVRHLLVNTSITWCGTFTWGYAELARYGQAPNHHIPEVATTWGASL